MNSCTSVVKGIDWALLREQKDYCVNEAMSMRPLKGLDLLEAELAKRTT